VAAQSVVACSGPKSSTVQHCAEKTKVTYLRVATIAGLVLVLANWTNSGAQAQESLAKFIDNVSGYNVRIQAGSEKCGVKDDERYKKTLISKIDAVGVTADPIAITKAYLFIWARAFGPLYQQCAVFMALRWGADFSSAAVRIDASLDADKNLIAKVKTVAGTFPAAFYLSSQLFVKLAPSTPDYVDEVIGVLVDDFKKARGG
jgi:hypothetical protein